MNFASNMEPTGVMDDKRLPTDENLMTDDFTVCDLGDEEVHFSRHSSDYYYCRQEATTTNSHNQVSRKSSLSSTSGNKSHPSYSKVSRKSSVGVQFQQPSSPTATPNFSIDLTQQVPTYEYDANNNEQITSNRLLNCLSNKLRRGSNYLNAPAKLVGQYLLGITIQSWSEFFNTSRMTKAPYNRHQLTRRLITNLSHFQGNYLCVSLILVIYCILTSPLLLIAIAAYLMALYLVTARSALGKQTRLFGYRLNLQQQYSFITMASLAPLWIAGAPSAIFWVIGASFFVVGLHASMYANEQLSAEQQLISSRAHNSLTLHTPTHNLNRQNSNGYTQIGHELPTTPVRYYNHYPGVAQTIVQSGPNRFSYKQLPQSGPKPAVQAGVSSTSYVSNAISQWMMFGSGGVANRSTSPGGSNATNSSAQTSNYDQKPKNSTKVPDVNIISRDYAGLGRVYEV